MFFVGQHGHHSHWDYPTGCHQSVSKYTKEGSNIKCVDLLKPKAADNNSIKVSRKPVIMLPGEPSIM